MVDKSLHITLHFQGTLIVLKSKHGPPIHPEIRLENFFIKDFRHFHISQIFIRRHEKLHDFHTALVGETELVLRLRIFSAILGRTA